MKKIPKPHLSEEEREKAVQQVREGATYSEVGRTFHVTSMAVMKWCQAKGADRPCRARTMTEEEKKQVVQQVRDGASIQSVSDQWHVAQETVTKWCGAEHVFSRWCKKGFLSKKEEAFALIQSGNSFDKVGKKLGVSAQTIWDWCKEQGIPSVHTKHRRRPDITKEVRENAVKEIQNGGSYAEIARTLNVDKRTVSNWCCKKIKK